MKKFTLYIIILFFSTSLTTFCGQDPDKHLFVAFWNLENLFDTTDDIDKDDADFLPDGSSEWTEERLERKMFNLSRAIRLMNNEHGPDILGVCEIEHQYLLDSMSQQFLSDFNFKSATLEAPDNRGIDNGVLYKADRLKLLYVQGDTVHLPDRYPTRLIFQAVFETLSKDTLYVFVNHWPSRRGGEEKSEPNRIAAAITLRASIDKVFSKNPSAKVIAMGDFNDEPTNVSVLNHLKAAPFKCSTEADNNFAIDTETDLFNLSYEKYEAGEGSYKYREDWNMIDQIIVSRELVIGNGLKYACDSYDIHKPGLIVTQSGQFQGAPFPTFGGRRYLGGYSDHFAVYAIFNYKK